MIYYSHICVGLTLFYLFMTKKNLLFNLTVITAKLLEKSLVEKSKIWKVIYPTSNHDRLCKQQKYNFMEMY